MKKIISIFLILLLGSFLFILTLRGEYGNPESITQLGRLNAETKPFESSHERAPYAEMLAIKNRGTIELGQELALFASPDVGIQNGRYYSFFPSGVSYISLPFYNLGSQFNLGQIAAYGSSAIFAVFTLAFIYLISIRIFKLPHWTALIAALTYGFATTSWSYSITIYQHAAGAFFTASLFYLVWKFKTSTSLLSTFVYGSLFWTGLGTSLFFDYPNILNLAPLPLYFLVSMIKVKSVRNNQEVSVNIFSLISILFFVLMVFFNFYRNYLYFGNWKIYGNSFPRYTTESALKTNKTVEKPKSTEEYVERYGRIFQEERIPTSSNTLLFGVDKGLFLFSPILILSFVGLIALRSRLTIEWMLLLGLIASNWLTYFSFPDPWGGWAYGPRYLIPSMTMLSILAASGLYSIKKRLLNSFYKIAYFVLFSVSSSIALAGVLTTNLIPPKVEADYLKLNYYNFTHAFDLLINQKTGNFIFSTFLRNDINLVQYFFIIWGSLQLIAFILLFILPLFEKHESDIHH